MRRGTWLLEASGAQSHRQTTDREIHSLHAPLASISISAPPSHPTTTPPYSLTPHPIIHPSLPLSCFLHQSLSFFHSQSKYPASPLSLCFFLWSIFFQVNAPLSNPYLILYTPLPSRPDTHTLPHLNAHLPH